MRGQSLQCLLQYSNVRRSLQHSSLLLQQRPTLLTQQHPSLQEAHILTTSAIKSTSPSLALILVLRTALQAWLKEVDVMTTLICQQHVNHTPIMTRSSMVLLILLETMSNVAQPVTMQWITTSVIAQLQEARSTLAASQWHVHHFDFSHAMPQPKLMATTTN
jgi:hypothetical protein